MQQQVDAAELGGATWVKPYVPPVIPVTLGGKIKELRKHHDLTVQQLADVVGLSKSAIGEMESGNTKSPGVVALAKIASRLGVSVEYLTDSERKMPLDDALRENQLTEFILALPATENQRLRDMIKLLWPSDAHIFAQALLSHQPSPTDAR